MKRKWNGIKVGIDIEKLRPQFDMSWFDSDDEHRRKDKKRKIYNVGNRWHTKVESMADYPLGEI